VPERCDAKKGRTPASCTIESRFCFINTNYYRASIAQI